MIYTHHPTTDCFLPCVGVCLCVDILEDVIRNTSIVGCSSMLTLKWWCWVQDPAQVDKRHFETCGIEILVTSALAKIKFHGVVVVAVAQSEWIYCSKSTVAPAQCKDILIHQYTILPHTPTMCSLPRGDGLLNSCCCTGRLLRSYDGLVGYNNVFELVLRDGVDGVCVCQLSACKLCKVSRDIQMPMTSEQIAKPVIVFFNRYGARARSSAGEARIRAS